MRYCGKIGYALVEGSGGVFTENIIEKQYYGDIIRNNRRLQSADSLNDNINISNQISIVSDPFAINNINTMRYAEFNGVKWKINNVDVQYPRLILELGGVYNGQ